MSTPQSIIDVLDRIRDYVSIALAEGAVVLKKDSADGRLNSQENERQLSGALLLFKRANEWFGAQGYDLIISEARDWHDFTIVGGSENQFIPVNIKVSAFAGQDNISSKEGLFYALTGVDPRALYINRWDYYCEHLAANLDPDTDADYYFLVVNKEEPGDVFWASLKSLEVLASSGSNWPYQCNWSINRKRIHRSNEEATRFLLSVLRESFAKGATPLVSFDLHLLRHIQT